MRTTKTFPKPEDILPHDKPMSLVDQITEFEPGKWIKATTTFNEKAFFYQGHFKGNPITPGVILLESMFQTCGLYLRISAETTPGFPMIMGRAVKVKNASFSKEVKPDQSIEILAKFKHQMMTFFVFDCQIRLDGKLVCHSELVLS